MGVTAAKASLTTFGSFRLTVNGRDTDEPSTKKARLVLVYLILNAGRPVPRERLLALLWPEADPERARASLSTALWSLRKSLRDAGAEDAIDATKTSIVWRLPTDVDALEFSRCASEKDAESRRRAIRLYAGDFLDGDYDEWSVSERERLAREYEDLLERALEEDPDAELARRLLVRDPYNEAAYCALIDEEVAAGRALAASELIDRYRRVMTDAGLAPSREFDARYAGVARVARPAEEEFALPLIGRSREFERLSVHTAALAERGSVTIVTGEPGIGKSALLHRFCTVASRNVAVHVVAAIDGDLRPYGPWGRLLSATAGGELDAVVQSSAQPARAVATAIADALSEPSVVVVDDAQYLTADAFEVLRALFAAARDRHCMVVAVRPEGLSEIRGACGEAGADEISLARVSLDEFTAAIERVVGGDAAAVAELVYRRSLGHPLFFAEIFKSLVRQGVLCKRASGWSFTGSAADVEAIPATLSAALERRLRSRGDAPAELACVLALDGEATLGDLQAASERDEDAAIDALDELLRLQAIEESNVGPHYRFTHDLVREVAATLLRRPRRARIHKLLAAHLEHATAPNATARRARHLAACGDVDAAARAYVAAAREASEEHAWQRATSYCDDALAQCEGLAAGSVRNELAATALLEKALAQSMNMQYADSTANASQALVLANANENTVLAAQALVRRAHNRGVTSAPREGILADVDAARNLASANGDDRTLLKALRLRLFMYLGDLQLDEAAAGAREGHAIALRLGLPLEDSIMLHYLASIEALRWRFDAARAALADGVRAMESCGRSSRVAQRFVEARVATIAGDIEAAKNALQDGFAQLERFVGEPEPLNQVEVPPALLELYLLYVSGCVALLEGDTEAAIAFAERTLLKNASVEGARLLLVEALAMRADDGDLGRARNELAKLPPRYCPNTLCTSTSALACEALIAMRERQADAAALLDEALDEVAADASKRPNTCDALFARLADVARQSGVAGAERATALAREFAELKSQRTGVERT